MVAMKHIEPCKFDGLLHDGQLTREKEWPLPKSESLCLYFSEEKWKYYTNCMKIPEIQMKD